MVKAFTYDFVATYFNVIPPYLQKEISGLEFQDRMDAKFHSDTKFLNNAWKNTLGSR